MGERNKETPLLEGAEYYDESAAIPAKQRKRAEEQVCGNHGTGTAQRMGVPKV